MVGNFGKARTAPCPEPRRNSKLSWTGSGIENDIKEFEGAGHAFMDDAEVGPRALRPLFRVMGIKPDPEAAAEAWQRIEDHFATAP